MPTNETWWDEHFIRVPNEIIAFLASDGLDASGLQIADIGTGDGIIAAGLAMQINSNIVGLDVIKTDFDALLSKLPPSARSLVNSRLSFMQVTDRNFPLADKSIEFIYSWSAAEHFMNPNQVFTEIARTLTDTGFCFIQTYPLWPSRHGHHLSSWLPEYWHLQHSRDELENYIMTFQSLPIDHLVSSGKSTRNVEEVLNSLSITRSDLLKLCLESYDSCNRFTLSQICHSIEAAGLRVAKIELISGSSHIPNGLDHFPMADLLIEGAKMIVTKK